MTTGDSAILSSTFVVVRPRTAGFSVCCPDAVISTTVGGITSEVTVCTGGRYWASPFPFVARGGKDCSFIVGTFPDPKPCKSAVSPLSVGKAVDSTICKVGREIVVSFVVESNLALALIIARLAVSVLAFVMLVSFTTGPLLRFEVDSVAFTGGLEGTVGWADLDPGCTEFDSPSLRVGLIGTSLRPLVGKGGQNRTVSLVGFGEEALGRSSDEAKEEEVPMTVCAFEEVREVR